MYGRPVTKKRKKRGYYVSCLEDDVQPLRQPLHTLNQETLAEELDETFLLSKDGLRTTTKVSVTYKRRVVAPSDLEDSLGDWTPMDFASTHPEYSVVDNSSNPPEARRDSEEENDDDPEVQSADYIPMERWLPQASLFLEELLYHDAYGKNVTCLREDCGVDIHCEKGSIRCKECCGIYCSAECAKAAHSRWPLHIVQEWTGHFWEPTTMKEVGLVYQLGHQGKKCPVPEPVVCQLIVVDVTGMQDISYRRCHCRAPSGLNATVQQLLRNAWYPATNNSPKTCFTFRCLDLFRLLNVVANTNTTDFMTTLARLGDPTGLRDIPVRSKAGIRAAQQWAYLHRAKHSGRAHCNRGLEGTKNGEMAVKCWCCPTPGINLPDGWDKVAPEWRFLYMIILSMDANFKLKNRIRHNEKFDPILGDGKGCFVESAPYKEHLRNYVGEKDVSNCVAFAALVQRDSRNTKGLRVSGVGAVSCARHELIRPNGIGDLQKGERYSNMDYIFFMSIFGLRLLYMMVCYDIACQWFMYLKIRGEKIPGFLALFNALWFIDFGLPLMHAIAHILNCGKTNAVSTRQGVGKTDAEGCERIWWRLNGMGHQTKEMGEGTRHSFLEDAIDYQNTQRNVTQNTSLTRKLAIAIEEEEKQRRNFEEVDRPIQAETRQKWEEMESAWLSDRSLPNPYIIPDEASPSEKQVREELEREEKEEMASGRRPVHGTSATAFLGAGIHLEGIQLQLRVDVKSETSSTPHESKKIEDRRRAFELKADGFRDLQQIYMPGAARAEQAVEDARNPNEPPPHPEDVKLWLPSDLPPSERRSRCVAGLPHMELRLRQAQCSDALREVRSRLHARQYLIQNRARYGGSQREGTRSATSITKATNRVQVAAEKYRAGRRAILQLEGKDKNDDWKELLDGDLKLLHEVDEDDENSQLLNNVTGSSNARPDRLYSSRGTTSWIWTAGGAPSADLDGGLHEVVRVEWMKSKMRKTRWWKEVQRLREEMRCALRSLQYLAAEWKTCGSVECGRTGMLAEGSAAYAARQCHLYSSLYMKWRAKWSQPYIKHGKWTLHSQHVQLTDQHLTPNPSHGSTPLAIEPGG